jgi:hypothetical protein
MARNRTSYWMLFTRAGGHWAPQFGAYTRGEVMQESRDSYSAFPAADRHIARCANDTQVAIDVAQRALQGQWLRSPDGYTMTSSEILEALRLPPNSPIPPDYETVEWIGEVRIWVVPRSEKGKNGLPNRRVLARCPICDTLVCAGHLDQHVGTTTCLKAQARITGQTTEHSDGKK